MQSVWVPEDAARHLEAILVGFYRALDEADELAELGQTNSAVLIAGTLLDYLDRSPNASSLALNDRIKIAEWRELRKNVTHSSAEVVTTQQARYVIEGVRRLLMNFNMKVEAFHDLHPDRTATVDAVKGKYAYVPMSSEDFMKAKREEIALEDCG